MASAALGLTGAVSCLSNQGSGLMEEAWVGKGTAMVDGKGALTSWGLQNTLPWDSSKALTSTLCIIGQLSRVLKDPGSMFTSRLHRRDHGWTFMLVGMKTVKQIPGD